MSKMSSMKSAHFLTGKSSIQSVFQSTIYRYVYICLRDQCDTINAKTIHGYSNFIYNEGQFDAEEAQNRDRWLSESYKLCMSEEVNI